MGGNVGIIIKKENGEQIAMDRWTNIMPSFFSQVSLYRGDTAQWYAEFSQQWEEMRQDYEKNKETKKYEHNMTDVYFPHDTNSPTEYGLIAVDFANKKIYSSQGYCSVAKVSAMRLVSNMYGDEEDIEEREEFLNFKALYDAGFIKKMEMYIDKLETIDLKDWSWNDLKTTLLEMQDSKNKNNFSVEQMFDVSREDKLFRTNFPIESQWKISSRRDDKQCLLDMKEEMENDGFVFTQEDNAAWAKYLQYTYYEYDESEASEEEKQEYEKFCADHKRLLGIDYVAPLEY